MKIFSFSPFGYEGSLVAVEVDLRRGIPAVDIVGLADGAVKESRERMRSAIRNSGFEFPLERVLISLSPADLKKEGAGFDLALALSVLDEQKMSEVQSTEAEDDSKEVSGEGREECSGSQTKILVMGELELSGQLRPVRGVHAAVTTAKLAGINYCIVSAQNGREAREVAGIKVFAAENLAQAFYALYNLHEFTEGLAASDEQGMPEGSVRINGVLFPPVAPELEMGDVTGQQKLVRALQIAAAGGHNLLAFGSPGCGKTLALQRFSSLLPLLSIEDSQSVTRIHSLAGLLRPDTPLMRMGDFRMPHQTASIEGICGGGINCRPGEISLAHNGVLFLDEAAEFRTSVLQMLRVPLETGSITLSRAGRSTVYPARFQLLMAANPCPCGNFGVSGKLCLCSARSIEMYWRKFSGPLLDRIDLRVSVANSKNEEAQTFTSSFLRNGIALAINAQRARKVTNARLTPQNIADFCKLDEESQAFLEKAFVKNNLSHRGYCGVLKVSRTIADLEGRENICLKDVQEALSFRADEGPLESITGCN